MNEQDVSAKQCGVGDGFGVEYATQDLKIHPDMANEYQPLSIAPVPVQ